MHILLLIVMVLSLATGGVVYAADSAAPGDPLYAIDRGVEDLRLSLTQKPEKRVALKLGFAEERLHEAQQLIEAEQDTYTIALDSYRETMTAVTEAIASADATTQTQLAAQVETAVVVHETIVTNWANQNADAGLVKANSALQSVRNASFSQTITPTLPIECTGANPHPAGSSLAQQYDVKYEEIMGWFCLGFGFGEIDQAYSLSEATSIDVADIFAMRDKGLGWGEIRQELQGHPGRGPRNGMGPKNGVGGPPDGAGPPNGNGNGNGNKPGSGPPAGAGPPEWAGPPAGAGPPGGAGPGNKPGRGGP